MKEAAQEMYDKKLDFSDKAQEELKVFERAVHDILDITRNSFIKGDLNLARQVEPMEEVIDGLSLSLIHIFRQHFHGRKYFYGEVSQ